MEELSFDKETAEGLYRIFAGLSSSCYENAKYDMLRAYKKVLEWGEENCINIRGEI